MSAGDFSLLASQLIPGKSAMLVSGTGMTNGGLGTISGDGLLCVSGGLTMHGVRIPNAAGETRWGPGLVGAGGLSAGEFRAYQVAYRDPQGYPCGAQYNHSNGVRVVFQP